MIMAISEAQLVRRRIHDIINECVMASKMLAGDGAASAEHVNLLDDSADSFTETGIETGRRWVMERVKRHNGQVLIPVLPDGKVLLQVRYRSAAKKWVVGFPSGFGIDDEDNWRDTADRMLLKEVGLTSTDMRVVGGTTLTGCTESNEFGVILARKCMPPSNLGQSSSVFEQQVEMTFDCLDELIGDGDIACCLTMSALKAFQTFRRRMEHKRG